MFRKNRCPPLLIITNDVLEGVVCAISCLHTSSTDSATCLKIWLRLTNR
jgi:hypothetical protein